ncbi:uncharacterized protein LOC142059187 [Phalacrocorax aristotelis]|uniref:uncharacterized protein LOC142059187 n=1 Tax=Phalacrocorax aristotelis TaxID=126867 RepID=UPI003F4C9493
MQRPPPSARGPRRVPCPHAGCPPTGLRAELPPSGSLAGGDPSSTRAEPPGTPGGRGSEFGIPAPLLHTLTSPTRHRGRSTLPGNPTSPTAPTGPHPRRGCCRPAGAGRKAGSNAQSSSPPSPPARKNQREDGACPRGAGTAPASRPGGYHFPRWSARSPARPQDPSGTRGISSGLGTARPPRPRQRCLEEQHPPTAGREGVGGGGHPPCRGLQPQQEDFPVTRGTLGPRGATTVSPRVAEPRSPACGRASPGQGRGGHPGGGRGTRTRLQPPTPRPVGGCSSPVSLSLPRTHRATLARFFGWDGLFCWLVFGFWFVFFFLP